MQEIIFVANGFLAKEIIDLIQHLPSGLSFYFHFTGTFSIEGSKHKVSSGDYIAVK